MEEIKESSDLLSWVVNKTDSWEHYRDTMYSDKWEEYYNLWRGIWVDSDKNRKSERSKFIAPALQQAIEATVAELEEATFGKGKWIDVSDDIQDKDKQDVANALSQLIEDFELQKVPVAVSETYLNGALYGTGIAKIVVEEIEIPRLEGEQIPGTSIYDVRRVGDTEVAVRLVAVEPSQFVIDPSARNIDEALGCAHVYTAPRHTIIDKQSSGYYKPVDIGSFNEAVDRKTDEVAYQDLTDFCHVIEYHGLVPREYLYEEEKTEEEKKEDTTSEELDEVASIDTDDDLVEAIVTIINKTAVVRAVENPFILQDRSFIAYQHDTIPNRFWGRGIAEKGYNPQKALDAEIRARQDSLALSTYPMVAIDATSVPRGESFVVRPGKTILTNGDPGAAIREFKFSAPDPQTYQQSAEFERMIQMGTGAMDSAAPVDRVNPRNATSSGMSMIYAGAIKRQKRTMQNIERNFLDPLVRKALWRYMQFSQVRYPVKDYKFVVHSTMGIMAREFETMQLTQLLNTVPPQSPAYWLLIRSIYENSSISNKEQMLQIIDMLLKQSLNPAPPPPDPAAQARLISAQSNAVEGQARIKADAERLKQEWAKLALTKEQMEVDREKNIIVFEQVKADKVKKQADSILALAKAEAEELGSQLEKYKAAMNQLQNDRDFTLSKLAEQVKLLEMNNRFTVENRKIDTAKPMESTGVQIPSTDNSEITGTIKLLTEKQQELDDQVKMLQEMISSTEKGLMSESDAGGADKETIAALKAQVDEIVKGMGSRNSEPSPIKIERDERGLVKSINGRSPKRNADGLIVEV